MCGVDRSKGVGWKLIQFQFKLICCGFVFSFSWETKIRKVLRCSTSQKHRPAQPHLWQRHRRNAPHKNMQMAQGEPDAKEVQSWHVRRASHAPSDILKMADPLSALRGRAAGKEIGEGIIGKRASEEINLYNGVGLIPFFLCFTHKHWVGWPCCARRQAEPGDIVSFNTKDSHGQNPERIRGRVNRICSDGKMLEISVDSSEDYGDVDDRRPAKTATRAGVRKSKTFREKSENCVVETNSVLAPPGPGEMQFRCVGCWSVTSLEQQYGRQQASRVKIRLRILSIVFVLAQVFLAISDTIGCSNYADWVVLGYESDPEFHEDPFCLQYGPLPIDQVNASNSSSQKVSRTSKSMMDDRASNLLQISYVLRCGIIIPTSVFILIFSFNKRFTATHTFEASSEIAQKMLCPLLNQRFWVMMIGLSIMGCAIAVLNGYKFVFWRAVSRFVHRKQLDWPRIPGHGDILLYVTYLFGYSSLPMYVCCACAFLTMVVWFLTSSILLAQPQFPDLEGISSTFVTVSLDGGLMFMLVAICFYQAYRREVYTRTAFLQKKLLMAEKNAVLHNQEISDQLLKSITKAMQMESHGIPGMVHVSKAAVKRLKPQGARKSYVIKSRGLEAAIPWGEETFIVEGKRKSRES